MKTLLIIASIIFAGSKLGCIVFDSVVETGKAQSTISAEKRGLDTY